MSKTATPLRDVLSAGMGAAVTDTIFNPLEVVKVRLQADRDCSVYRSIRQCASRMLAEEGVLLIWRHGLVATWMRGMSQTALRVGLYPSVKTCYMEAIGSDNLLLKVASGATTGAIGAAIANPVDLVRVKFQGESGRIVDGVYTSGLRAGQKPSHANTFAAFVDIVRHDGIQGLWRGVSASMARVSLLSGAQLSTYDQTKQIVVQSGWCNDGPTLHVSSACFSGFVAQAACMPADVVKTRVQSGLYTQRYRNPLHCLLSILRDESVLVLYRGFLVAAARQVPVMMVQMPIVEQIRFRFFGLGYI